MLGSLAFGRFGPLGLHALFSVLQGAKAPFPCRGVGQRPTSSNTNFQSANFPILQSSNSCVRQHAKICINL